MESSLTGLILSASLGALIGLIRQWGEQQDGQLGDRDFAGLRTYILWALAGYASALLTDVYAPFLFQATMLMLALHLVLFGRFGAGKGGVGLTTAASAILTLFLGGLVYWQHLQEAVMLAALTMLVLGLKQSSHDWTQRFTKEDIRSTLQFTALTGVVLPLVPNQAYGPFDAFNPYSLWLMVVLISGLGFVGYVLVRLFGTRSGVALTGLLGGLASSTATTLAFSRESRQYPDLSASFALAIVMACTIMLGRVLVLLGLIYPRFIAELWLPFLILGLPGLFYALWIGLIHRPSAGEGNLPELKNPLSLSIAVKFALLYGLVGFLVKALSSFELSGSLLALSFVSGLTDMDAIALSVANHLKEGGVTLRLATQAVIVGAVANTLLKAGLAISLGSSELRRHVVFALGGTAIAGLFAFYLTGL